jgi:hypothetical protein
MATLGCACTSSAAYFALLNGDALVADPLERIDVAHVLERGEQLLELRERIRVELERIRPDAVAILGSTSQPASYNVAAERATIEAIVQLVAAEQHVPSARLSPPTVSARLGLSRTGSFATNARSFFRDEHPPFWAERCKAAAVAVAWQRR